MPPLQGLATSAGTYPGRRSRALHAPLPWAKLLQAFSLHGPAFQTTTLCWYAPRPLQQSPRFGDQVDVDAAHVQLLDGAAAGEEADVAELLRHAPDAFRIG